MLVLVEHSATYSTKARVASLILLHQPHRKPLLQHRVHQHLQQRERPTALRWSWPCDHFPSSAPPHKLRPLRPLERLIQVLHAEIPVQQGRRRSPVRERLYKASAAPLATIHRCATFYQPVTVQRRHISPVCDHGLPREGLMQRVAYVGTVSTEVRQHLQGHLRCRPPQHASAEDILPIKLPERYISNPRLLQPPFLIGPATRLSSKHPEALVELVHLTVPHHRPATPSLGQLLLRLQHAHSSCVQRHHWHERKYRGQAKPHVHRFKHAVVAATQRSRIKLLQALPHQIERLPFARVLAHLIHRLPQYLAQRLRPLGRLRRILRHVLHHRPKVQHRPPVHIAQVSQQDMGLISATQSIVPRKARSPLPLTISSLQKHRLAAATLH